jgi:hypothetical protein
MEKFQIKEMNPALYLQKCSAKNSTGILKKELIYLYM